LSGYQCQHPSQEKKSQHIGNKRHLINHPTNKDAPGPNVSIGQPLGVTRVRGSELFHNRHDAAWSGHSRLQMCQPVTSFLTKCHTRWAQNLVLRTS
jgi:hypothetical protein